MSLIACESALADSAKFIPGCQFLRVEMPSGEFKYKIPAIVKFNLVQELR